MKLWVKVVLEPRNLEPLYRGETSDRRGESAKHAVACEEGHGAKLGRHHGCEARRFPIGLRLRPNQRLTRGGHGSSRM